MEKEEMVKAGEIFKRYHIARSTFYQLVKDGRIKAHDVTEHWHTRRQMKFLLSEVEAVLGPPS